MRKDVSKAKAVKKAIFSKTHDLQSKLERFSEGKKAVADRNHELMKTQNLMKSEFKEIEERLKTSLKSKDEKILDLQDEIRDLKVYVDAQKRFSNGDPDGVRGGTLLSLESSKQFSGKPKRKTSGRRRN